MIIGQQQTKLLQKNIRLTFLAHPVSYNFIKLETIQWEAEPNIHRKPAETVVCSHLANDVE